MPRNSLRPPSLMASSNSFTLDLSPEATTKLREAMLAQGLLFKFKAHTAPCFIMSGINVSQMFMLNSVSSAGVHSKVSCSTCVLPSTNVKISCHNCCVSDLLAFSVKLHRGPEVLHRQVVLGVRLQQLRPAKPDR
eukprot:3418741-Amphidinium_carterae.2